MRISDFELYKDLLIRKSGLTLTPDKSYLLDSRLTPVAKKWGYASLDAMAMALRGVPDNTLVKDVVEAMTTNETSFFRDQKPFDLFRDTVLPHFLKTRVTTRRVRIWCAACSSGQEPYSLAMLLKENAALLSGWNFEILATDLSGQILEQAQKGLFTQFEVQRGLPIQYLMKYFVQQEEKWQISDEIRRMVRFQPLNLLEDIKGLGTFDVIFCRNVLIYFDEATKGKVLQNLSGLLAEDGFLFLGGAETVIGITEALKPMPGQRGVYILQDSDHGQNAVSVAK